MLRCQCPSVCPSVRLSIANLGFKFRSHFTAHCGRRAARRAACAGGSSRAMLASARPSRYLMTRDAGDRLRAGTRQRDRESRTEQSADNPRRDAVLERRRDEQFLWIQSLRRTQLPHRNRRIRRPARAPAHLTTRSVEFYI